VTNRRKQEADEENEGQTLRNTIEVTRQPFFKNKTCITKRSSTQKTRTRGNICKNWNEKCAQEEHSEKTLDVVEWGFGARRTERTHDCLNGFDMFAKRLSKAGNAEWQWHWAGRPRWKWKGADGAESESEPEAEAGSRQRRHHNHILHRQDMASNHRIWRSQFRFSHSKSALPIDSGLCLFDFSVVFALPACSCQIG